MKAIFAIVLAATLIAALIIIAVPVVAVVVNETCLDDTMLQTFWNYTLCEGDACTVYNQTEVQECTNGCSNNRCVDPTEDRVIYAGLVGVVVCAFLSVVLIWLGFKFETETTKEAEPFKKVFEAGMKMIFLVVGVFFAYSTIALGYTVMVSGSSSVASLALVESLMINMGRIMYFFVFVIMISFLVTVMLWWAGIAKTRNYEKSSGYRSKRRR